MRLHFFNSAVIANSKMDSGIFIGWSPTSFPVVLSSFGCDVTCQSRQENSPGYEAEWSPCLILDQTLIHRAGKSQASSTRMQIFSNKQFFSQPVCRRPLISCYLKIYSHHQEPWLLPPLKSLTSFFHFLRTHQSCQNVPETCFCQRDNSRTKLEGGRGLGSNP